MNIAVSTPKSAKPLELKEITTSAAWRGDVLSKSDSWVYMLSDAQIAELEVLGARFVEADPDLRFVQKEEYPLVECAEAINEWGRDVDSGRGFVLVRGLKTHLYSDALSAAIYYILGLHMGDPIRQNEKGDLIDSVYATSDKTMDDPTAKSSKVRDHLVFHSDSSDVVALMCLRPAREGGASCLVSGAEIYNEILRRRPDLAPLLFEPYHWDWRRQDKNAPADTYTSPIIDLTGGVFSMYAGSLYILTAQEYEGVPKLSPEQIEVLELFDKITYEPGMAIEMDFRPGDIQWLSNYAALHARTTFYDYPEPQRRRHLLRLWLSRQGERPVIDGFGKNGVVQVRHKPREGQTVDDQGFFRIKDAPVPRLLADHG
ncbi:TauD/TfdA family dioxygenase [Asticcacaulis sp. SL142]|uniref:TauD/TfdA family dioxygenase n=1 Tax=Asticcacaulis sp. SL142 TaxID=2995155 RepID=UPI00226CA6AE|nr:TauD/TfdA family dioxygenase [Asticcacaulis sp. SL142]WAC47971.1 TauD/TfdA family dioxygenase [Asticcacaulis sp. SL142]